MIWHAWQANMIKTLEKNFCFQDDKFQYLTQEIADGKGFLVNSVEQALKRVLTEGASIWIDPDLLDPQSCFPLLDDTYFLTDKAFADGYVFKDHKARYTADREQARQEGCRLSVAPGFEFGSLPYGLMLRKGNPVLNEKINGMWVIYWHSFYTPKKGINEELMAWQTDQNFLEIDTSSIVT